MTDSHNQPDINLAAGNLGNTPFEFTVGVEGSGARFTTIQAAINAAVADGGTIESPRTVLVFSGTYVENVSAAIGVGVTALVPLLSILQGTLTVDLPAGLPLQQTATLWDGVAIDAPAGQSAFIFTGTTPQICIVQNCQMSSVDTATLVHNNTGIEAGSPSILSVDDSSIQVENSGVLAIQHSAGVALFEQTVIEADDASTAIELTGNAIELHILNRITGQLDLTAGTALLQRTSIEGDTIPSINIDAGSVALLLYTLINNPDTPSVSGTGILLHTTIAFQSTGSLAGTLFTIPLLVEGASNLVYSPIVPNWVAPAPTNVQSALDRLSTAVFGLVGPIP